MVYTLLLVGKYEQERMCPLFKFVFFCSMAFSHMCMVCSYFLTLFCFSTSESCFCSNKKNVFSYNIRLRKLHSNSVICLARNKATFHPKLR